MYIHDVRQGERQRGKKEGRRAGGKQEDSSLIDGHVIGGVASGEYKSVTWMPTCDDELWRRSSVIY